MSGCVDGMISMTDVMNKDDDTDEEEVVLWVGPCLSGFVGISHVFLSEDSSASVWARRMRFFPSDGDGVSECVQGEVLVRLPSISRVAAAAPPGPGQTQEEKHLFLLQCGIVDTSDLRLGYHRAFLYGFTHLRLPGSNPSRLLVLGNGCGALTDALLRTSDCNVVGVELDPGILALGPAMFGFVHSPRFTPVVGDGLAYIQVSFCDASC